MDELKFTTRLNVNLTSQQTETPQNQISHANKTTGGMQGNRPRYSWHSRQQPRDRDEEKSSTKHTPGPSSKMADFSSITDEDELHKMLHKTESFDERRKIRGRLKELREAATERSKFANKSEKTEDSVQMRLRLAEEEKRKKLESFDKMAHDKKPEKDSREDFIKSRQATAQAEKERKLQEYSQMAGTVAAAHHATNELLVKGKEDSKTTTKTETHKDGGKTTTTTTTSTQRGPGGSTTTTRQTKTVTKVGGVGGTGYMSKAQADETAVKIKDMLAEKSAEGTQGLITVRTESWNSVDGTTNKAEHSQTWGGKQNARSAMSAFKQMDNTSGAPAAKPSFLSPGGAARGGRGGGRVAVQRSPSAIKQMLLDWTKAMTQEYENVNITNFSSSWNDGMAFCALIHHFYPDAFDFSKLEPKNRRYNFTLAFEQAEKCADISPLLEVDDMVRMKNPDWKCVFCYVQSFYRHLREHPRCKVIKVDE